MKICPSCTKANEDTAAFCSGCGTNMTAVTGSLAHPAEQKTSGMAVASLIFGIFFFIFPAAVMAIVLGHISHSQIKKSAGRLAGAGMSLAGMILGYAGVAFIPFILIIAAIAIPNLLRARMAANEAAAVGNLRTAMTASMTYYGQYNSYPPSLEALGPPPAGQPASADAAGLIGAQLLEGVRSGYVITYEQTKGTGASGGGFDINADPFKPNNTGIRHFHADETGVIRVDSSGPADRDSPELE